MTARWMDRSHDAGGTEATAGPYGRGAGGLAQRPQEQRRLESQGVVASPPGRGSAGQWGNMTRFNE